MYKRSLLDELLDFFSSGPITIDDLQPVCASALPEPHRRLLAHEYHMTVTLEEFHGCPLHLNVLAVHHDGTDYAREITLTAGAGGLVVLAGVMRFDLQKCQENVRREIVAARTPLGRILINLPMMRRIQIIAFFKVDLQNGLGKVFNCASEVSHAYGRLALIFCDEQPAVELLEIVSPAR